MISLIVVLGLAAWMRFDDMGRFSFWTDELYHVVAAQSMIEGGEPMIPARGMYWRSFLVTGMTVVSFSIFGESEWSARFPFALVSMVFLVVVYRVLATRFSRLLALLTVLFLGLTPQFLQAGRECRMYAPFVLFYFLGVIMAYRVMEAPVADLKRRPLVSLLYIGMTLLFFVLAMSLQYLAVNFGFTLLLYCLLMAGYLVVHLGWIKATRSRYLALTALSCLTAITTALFLQDFVATLISLAREPMAWDTRGHPAPFCLWFFNYYFPALWYVYPIGAVILIHRYGRLGLYMVCAFLPVLFAHMYLFTSRIAERYLLYILPFFFLTSACVIEALLWGVMAWVRELRSRGTQALAAVAAICVLPASWLFLQPWLNSSLELRRYGLGPDWKLIAPDLRAACETGIVITNWPREVMFYGGRFPDYFATQTYEYYGKEDHVVALGEREVEVNYLTDTTSLREALGSGTDVFFVTTDWAYRNNSFMNEEMREVIRRNMIELASIEGGEDRVVIFRTIRAQ